MKKEIQVGHLITTVTVAVAAVAYITSIEHRVELLEHSVTGQRERDAIQDKHTSEAAQLLRGQLERIEAKLDRLIEKRNPQ